VCSTRVLDIPKEIKKIHAALVWMARISLGSSGVSAKHSSCANEGQPRPTRYRLQQCCTFHDITPLTTALSGLFGMTSSKEQTGTLKILKRYALHRRKWTQQGPHPLVGSGTRIPHLLGMFSRCDTQLAGTFVDLLPTNACRTSPSSSICEKMAVTPCSPTSA
jgi:hypothetical protein